MVQGEREAARAHLLLDSVDEALVRGCAQHVAVVRVVPLLDAQPLDLDREDLVLREHHGVQDVCPAATAGSVALERAEERDRALLRVLPRNASIAGMHEDSEKTKVGCGVTTEARDRLFSSSGIPTDSGERLDNA